MRDSKAKQDSGVHLIMLRAVETPGSSPPKVVQNLSGLGELRVADRGERNSGDRRS